MKASDTGFIPTAQPPPAKPAPPAPAPTPPPPPSGGTARNGLALIAFFCGGFFVLTPFISASQSSRNYVELAGLEAAGGRGRAQAREDARREAEELGHNSRAALIALAVALAGLASPRR